MALTQAQREQIIFDCLRRAERKHGKAHARFLRAEERAAHATGLSGKYWDWRAKRLCNETFRQKGIMERAQAYLA